jgi:hypothetical protein
MMGIQSVDRGFDRLQTLEQPVKAKGGQRGLPRQ